MNGKSGLFPSNFVKELETTGEDGDSAQSHNHTAEETGTVVRNCGGGLQKCEECTY